MTQTLISAVQLKGPAGNTTVDKRTKIAQLNLHGPKDIRTLITQVTLVAPPPDKRTRISRVHLAGPTSSTRPAYVGTSNGWIAVEVYLPINGAWTKVT